MSTQLRYLIKDCMAIVCIVFWTIMLMIVGSLLSHLIVFIWDSVVVRS